MHPSETAQTCEPICQPIELPGELWGITTYFNPAAYAIKLDNLRVFSEGVRRQGLKLLLVELAFDKEPYAVPDDWVDRIIRVRSGSILWQKERLLNIALEQLPDRCDKVAWLDADIVFGNDAWVQQTSGLLGEYVAVQPYSNARWLAPRVPQQSCEMKSLETEFDMAGIAYARIWAREALGRESHTNSVGHPGFAWTARRDVLARHGFYDRFIVGSGDRVMSLSMYGYHQSSSMRNFLASVCSERQIGDVLDWAASFYSDVRGSVFYVEGPIFHLWHGNSTNRRYLERHKILRDAEFDPRADICVDANGCWQWSSDKPELHQRLREYFESREEGSQRSKTCSTG